MTDTFTVGQLAEAINANDADRARQILDAQPDLVRTDMAYENEHPTSAGGAGNVEKAKRLIADEAAGMLSPGFIGPNETPGELLLWSGGAGGHTEIVRLALPIFN
jgi:hypothetical protein